MYTPSWPSFQMPMTGTSVRPLMAAMSDRPWQRMPPAPPSSHARAICAIVSGWRSGSPMYAWQLAITLPRNCSMMGFISPTFPIAKAGAPALRPPLWFTTYPF